MTTPASRDGILALPETLRPNEASWLHFVLEVTESISSADGIDNALNRLSWLALRATGADRSAILVPDPRNPLEVQPAAAASRTGDLAALWNRFRSMDPINLSTDLRRPAIWHSTEVIVIEDVASSSVIPESWKLAWGSKSIAYAPLRAAGEMFGILAVEYVDAPYQFTADEIKLLQAIAAAAGVALRSASLVERLQHAINVERRLTECSAALLAGRSLDDVLDEIADRFGSLFPDSACGINLLNADATSFRLVAWRGRAPAEREITIRDLPAEDVQLIQATWGNDSRQVIVVPGIADREGWNRFIPPGVSTGMLIPLVEGTQTLGFVAVGKIGGLFADEEIRLASAFADQAALALVQARLTEALQLRLSLVEALSRLEETVIRSSDLRSVLRKLNRRVGRGIGVRCMRLSFADRALAHLLRAQAATDDELEQIRRWRHSPEPEEVREGSAFSVPVRVHGRIAGILHAHIEPADAVRLDLVRSMAGALGEVAYKAKLQHQEEHSAQELAVAADRERMARDLHDTVGQTLYGIGLNIQDILYDVTDPDLREKLAAVRVLASNGVAEVRSAVYALSFIHVRDRGLVEAIQMLARDFTLSTDVEVQLRTDGNLEDIRDDVQSVLYRIAHEALVNVERHARATGVILTLRARTASVELSIRDDGVGLAQREARDWRSSAHFGMRMMAKSVEEIGGSFHAAALSPRGFHIVASVPANPSVPRGGVGG